MSPLLGALLTVATVANGLLAGTFFVFACAVLPGFHRVDDATFINTVRAINRAILNGWFLLPFCLAPLAAIACAALSFWGVGRFASMAMGIGAGASLLTFIITSAKSVPLNNFLEHTALGTEAHHRTVRGAFERPWARWNLVRTLTSLAALSCFVIAGVFS